MTPAPPPRRWSIDLTEQATLPEKVGAAALVAAAAGLLAIALARAAGAHAADTLFAAAIGVAGAGVVVLSAALGSSLVRNARRTVWAARADDSRPGLLLFLLEPVLARPDAETAVRRLAAVRCVVGGAGLTDARWEASDQRISRIGGVLMTRFHGAFFTAAPKPWSGTYECSWEECQPDGVWRALAGASVLVTYQPLGDETSA